MPKWLNKTENRDKCEGHGTDNLDARQGGYTIPYSARGN